MKRGSGRHWVDMVPYEFEADTLFFATPEQIHDKEDVKTFGTAICFTNEFFVMEQNADLLQLHFVQHIVKEYQQTADLQDEMPYAYIRVMNRNFPGSSYNNLSCQFK